MYDIFNMYGTFVCVGVWGRVDNLWWKNFNRKWISSIVFAVCV